MTHYDVSDHLKTIANIWEHWTKDDLDNRYLLDGTSDRSSDLYDMARELAGAMLDVAVPEFVELPFMENGGLQREGDADYADPTLSLMASLTNDPSDDEHFVFPIDEFCGRFDLEFRTLQLSDDDSDEAAACRVLLDKGTSCLAVSACWAPRCEPGEALILKNVNEDGPFAIFAREKIAKAA